MDKVKRILAEAEAPLPIRDSSTHLRSRLFSALFGYASFNLAATLYDYRVASNKASELLEKHGEAEVTLHLQSFSFTAALTSKGGSSSSSSSSGSSSSWEDDRPASAAAPQPDRTVVYVLPHIYLLDCLSFRSTKWTLNVKKRPGHSHWWTDGEEGSEPGSSGFSSSSSSSVVGRGGSV